MKGPRVLFVGRATLDALYRLDQFPAEDTKAFATEMISAPGGPALNAAITHSLLGGKSVLLSAIGSGPWAERIRKLLTGPGISLIDLAEGTSYEAPLTTVLVNAASATRTIVNPPQWTGELPVQKAWQSAWGPQPGVVLCDGFHLREALPLLRECQAAGCAICLDGGSWKPGTAELAPLLNVAICSERFQIPGSSSGPQNTLDWFAAQGVPHVAVTRGSKPIFAHERGRRFEIPIRAANAVDTLGAGDVLHGAFSYYFSAGEGFEVSLRQATEIATRSCEGMGITCWSEDFKKTAARRPPRL